MEMNTPPTKRRARRGRKDYHKNKDRRAPYFGGTIPIDGEGFEFLDAEGNSRSRYCLLQAWGCPPLVAEEGLCTEEVFRYIFECRGTNPLVGYAINYDIDNWLCDLSEEEYLRLVRDSEEIEWRGFHIKWIPRKMLTLRTTMGILYSDWSNPEAEVRVTVFDAIGYYQTSLVSALDAAGLEVPSEIVEGKAARGGFTWDQFEKVLRYNNAELDVMRRLFKRTWRDISAGLEHVGMPKLYFGSQDWYGPGALAKKFLREIKWMEGHPLVSEGAGRQVATATDAGFWSDDFPWVAKYPFSLAYFGGRIETAAVGEWETAYEHDLNSAYPAAMTHLPHFAQGRYRFTRSKKLIKRGLGDRVIGMVHVTWALPSGWDFYPFPYRTQAQGVCFPPFGSGWVMTPEYYAVADTIGTEGVRADALLYIDGTGGYGDGLRESDFDSAEAVRKLYHEREKLKMDKNPAQLGLKLVLNSLYGLLWRQIGQDPEKPKLFSDFSGAWITSWCRAMLWRKIAGHHTDHTVIALATDGITASIELGAEVPGLGGWKNQTVKTYRQYLPGIADFWDENAKHYTKRRGYTKGFDPEKAWAHLTGKLPTYEIGYRFYCARRHAFSQPHTFGAQWRQWVDDAKEFRIDLSSKRKTVRREGKAAEVLLRKGETVRYTTPRSDCVLNESRPFKLKFKSSNSYITENPELQEAQRLEDAPGEEGFMAGIVE